MNQSSANQQTERSAQIRDDEWDVIVVGAGFAGLYMVHEFKEKHVYQTNQSK
jgi:succinate dehydrogenase/fumarate reductase flavoprotein subunit